MAELRKDVEAVQEQSAQCARILSDLKDNMVAYKVRLENGTNVFRAHDERIREVEAAVKPKPVPAIKIIGITVSVLAIAMGALWGLSMKLSDRPTLLQIESMFSRHDSVGHVQTSKEIGEIRLEQAAQRSIIQGVQTAVGGQDDKLDELLTRVPKPRDR